MAVTSKMKEPILGNFLTWLSAASVGKSLRFVKVLRKTLPRSAGGDVTGKKKLLEKQKLAKTDEATGSVEIPQEAFPSVLKVDR